MGLLTLSKLQEIYKSANIFYFCNVFMVGSLLCFWQGICILKIFFNSSFFMVQLIFAPLPLWWRISLKLYRKVKTLWLWSFGSWSTSVSLILDIKWDLPWGRQWRRPASKDAFPPWSTSAESGLAERKVLLDCAAPTSATKVLWTPGWYLQLESLCLQVSE